MTSDNTIVTVVLPVGLVKKMTKPWYLVKQDEAEQVRAAMRHAISWLPKDQIGSTGISISGTRTRATMSVWSIK